MSDDITDETQLVILDNKDRLETNVALAEGLGVVDDVVDVASVALPSSNSAMGALGVVCSVDSVSGVGTAIELGT